MHSCCPACGQKLPACDKVEFNEELLQVTYKGRAIYLTRSPFKTLQALVKANGRTVTIDSLWDIAEACAPSWKKRPDYLSNLPYNYVCKARAALKKLDAGGIQTVQHVGYFWKRP